MTATPTYLSSTILLRVALSSTPNPRLERRLDHRLNHLLELHTPTPTQADQLELESAGQLDLESAVRLRLESVVESALGVEVEVEVGIAIPLAPKPPRTPSHTASR
ncbi:hypothetical protein T439DRAFT_358485 [Meredithblackwellia eburnea MCA 4105]